jgi:DNA polymerase-3 subunit alpha
VFIGYQNTQAQAEVELGIEWSITPNDSLLFELERLLGKDNVTLHFDQG